MAKKKKRNVAYDPAKTVKRFMKGLEIAWTVEDPLSEDHELEAQHFRHISPLKNLIVRSMMDVIQPALHSLPYKWHIDVSMEFHDGLNTYLKGYSIISNALLRRVNDAYFDTVEKLFAEANMAHYVTTHINCTILADGEIKEEDFA